MATMKASEDLKTTSDSNARSVQPIRNAAMNGAMATTRPDEKRLVEAFSIIENTPEIQAAVCKLRELLNVDHVVYN